MPASFYIRVLPRACRKPDRRVSLTVSSPPVGVECLDNGVDVAHRRAGSVGVPAVRDHLHIDLTARKQSPLEILIDLNDQQDALLIDHVFYIRRSPKVSDTAKHSGAVQAGEQLL